MLKKLLIGSALVVGLMSSAMAYETSPQFENFLKTHNVKRVPDFTKEPVLDWFESVSYKSSQKLGDTASESIHLFALEQCDLILEEQEDKVYKNIERFVRKMVQIKLTREEVEPNFEYVIERCLESM